MTKPISLSDYAYAKKTVHILEKTIIAIDKALTEYNEYCMIPEVLELIDQTELHKMRIKKTLIRYKRVLNAK